VRGGRGEEQGASAEERRRESLEEAGSRPERLDRRRAHVKAEHSISGSSIDNG
jgi:hypothetical protein